jgi:nucleotide-binding universal stress UspA family protein
MYQNIIVGVDEHQGGRDAIALTKRLAAPNARITLTFVHPGDVRPWGGSSDVYGMVEHERADEALALAREQAALDAEVCALRAPSVGHGLHVLAEDTGADLLVVGSSRHGLLGRLLLGDDTRAALDGAPCAVAIASIGLAQEPALMREIGVGYNGSEESRHALNFARQLAREHGAKVSAFQAVSLPAYLFTGGPAPVDDSIEVIVSEARQEVAALEGIEAHAAYGNPAEELALYSASLDLLILGSRDYGPLGRLVHGSTTRELARSARCSLLVLTRAARASSHQGPAGGQRGAAGTGVSTG